MARLWFFSWRIIVVIVVLGSAIAWVASSSRTSAGKCVPTASASATAPPTKVATTLAAVGGRTTDPPEIEFGLSRGDKTLAPYSYAVTGTFPDTKAVSWDLLMVSGNEKFPDDHVGVRFSNVLGQLRVSVCLKGSGVATGTYAGGLSFVGPTFKAQQLPLTISLKDNDLTKIWLGVVVAAGLAVFFEWWSTMLADRTKSNAPSLRAFLTWIGTQWVTVLIAVVGAVGVVYRTRFVSVADFTPDDRWPLWAATFTAVTASALLVTSFGAAINPAAGPEPDPNAGAPPDSSAELDPKVGVQPDPDAGVHPDPNADG